MFECSLKLELLTMGDWEQIVFGFNGLDETINFGARRSGELDSLYEITTLATIKSDNLNTTHVPIIHSAIVNGLLYFTINNTLKVFSNINCTSLSCSLNFNDDIDTFCTAMDGSLLLLCFRTGAVYLLMMGDPPNFLCEKSLFENEDLDSTFFINAFSNIEPTGIVFHLTSRNGMFYRIICPSEITPSVNKDEFILDLMVDLNTDVRCVLYQFPVLLFANSEKGILYNVRNKEIISEDIGCYKKIYPYTKNVCIGMNNEGELKSICTRTSFTTQIDTDELFEDFLLIKDKDDAYFLGTTKKDELGISFIIFLSYPEYKTIFSIKLSEVIHLIIPEYAYDEIMFIAEIRNEEAIKELRFQTISETIPENRLRRLLRRQKFDEAEKFAKLFNLDLIEIKKAKAQMIVDKSVCTEDDITNLINSLEDVDDCCFKIVSCLDIHACCSSLKDVERILMYTKSVPFANKNQELETLQRRASELFFRFQTFMMLVRVNPLRYNVSKWYDFYNCDLIYEMDTLLAQGDIEEWKIIYSRLDVSSLEEFSESDLTKTLDRISEYNISQQLVLLNTVVPLTLKYMPGSVNYFIQWMIKKVYIIRGIDFANFPENALQFVNKVTELLKIDSSNKLNVRQQTVIDVDCLATLRNLVTTLSKLKILKERYGVVLSFQEFLEGPKTLIQALLSTLTYGFQNEKFFQDFIEMFILNSSVKPDECFGNIINDIILQEECWIKVALLMLNYINSIDKKLEITIIILKAAKLPWCDAIRRLALNSLKYSHPLVQEIHYEIQEETRSVIFRKEPYNIDSSVIENTMKFMEFAFNRIIYCNEPTVVEDVYQICRNPKEKVLADRLLIQHFVEIGDFDFGLKILNSCEDTLKCCENVVQGLFVTRDVQYVHNLENYYQIIESVRAKFDNSSLLIKRSRKDTIDALKGIHFIRRTFNVDIKLSDLYTKSKTDLIVPIIRNIADKHNAVNDIMALINECETVASILQLENHFVFLELCENVEDFNIILNAAKVVFETTNDSDILCKMATLIITHAGAPDINLKVSELQSFQDFGNIDLEPFLHGFELARKIVTKAVINSSCSNVVHCLKLGDWMEVAYSLVQSKTNVLYAENTCTDESMLPSMSVFNAIKECFYFYRNFLNFPAYEVKVSNADNSLRIAEGQVLTEIRYLHSTITNLTSEGNALIAYKLIKTLHCSLTFQLNSKNVILQHLVAILKNSAMHLVKYIFSSSLIDFNLTVHLLIICDDVPNCKRVLFQNLKRYKRNLHKVERIAQAYLDYVKYYDVDDGQILCKNLLCLIKWWKRLKNCHIPYDEFFATKPKDNLVKLIKCNDLNIDMIYEFCSSVGENEQNYYKLYLQNLFLNWKPNFTVFVDNYGNECITMDHDHKAYVDLCYEAIQVIDDHDHSVICLLDSIWDKINVYHYEIFKCGLDLLSTLNKSKCQKPMKILLSFLNNYRRASNPGEAEKEQWFTLYPDTQCIDPLSKWRLPFTPTLMSKDIWSIIRPEISLKTYKKWFDLLSVLKYLNKDDICSYVIKDVMASDQFTVSENRWLKRARHKDLLYEIDVCVGNMSNLEQATSAMYSLLSKIPGGGDLVMAAALCYNYALKYQEENPNSSDVEKAFLKVQKKYIHYSIIHILHINRLAEKKYLDMVSGPIADLIESLYMDNRILQSAEKIDFDCPDINITVEQLAALYQIDIEKKRKELLQNWLSIGSQENVLSLSASFKSVYDCSVGYEYLIRASYLCTSGNICDWQYYLLSIGNVDLNESKSSGMKVMALKCFCNITDPKTVESLTGVEINDFRNSINKLSLINELPNFGFCLTMDSLDNKSKSELLSQLSYHLNNKVAVKTMALICITYKLYEARYWKIITTAMIKLKMFQELKESNIFLKKNVALYNCQWYIDSWQLIINNEFNSVANAGETTVRNQYVQNFFLIQDCPVSVNLDLVPKLCLQTNQYDLLILSLQYLTIQQQEYYLEELHKLNVSTDDKIEQLTTLGFWGVQYVKDIVLKYKNK